jgi:hypothetical protein
MAWFKVDDKLHDHRKARAAGTAAMGVWVLAGSWAADNLTDGFVPSAILPRFGRQREANKLVEVGLWHTDEQDGETGWRFHEWDERQPTRAQKLAEREAKAEAGRIGGLRSGRSRREASTKQSASGLVEPPSRPDPTRPNTEANASVTDDRFDEFWETYSHKVGRKKAETAYRAALKKPGITEDRLVAAAAAYITWQMSEGKHPTYTKHPATWLAQECWRDERSTTSPPPSNFQRHLALAAELASRETGAHAPRQIGSTT